MKKIIGLLVIAVIIVGIAIAKNNTKHDVVGGKSIVKIGVIYPMSGEFAHAGEAMKTAIKIFCIWFSSNR